MQILARNMRNDIMYFLEIERIRKFKTKFLLF